ncbi:hypothetical protein ScPMuIL_004033 [Solemya velum]
MTTDYWEYRGFDFKRLIKDISSFNATKLIVPTDTDSYIQLKYESKQSKALSQLRLSVLYQPPVILQKYFYLEDDKHKNSSNEARKEILATTNVILFVQYGNLFRDCEALEDGVRVRLGLKKVRRGKCIYLGFQTDAPIHTYVPAVPRK